MEWVFAVVVIALLVLGWNLLPWWGRCFQCHRVRAFPYGVVLGSALFDETEYNVCRRCVPSWEAARQIILNRTA